MKIEIQTIKEKVYALLSSLGKRLKAKDGSGMFQTTTLTSAEESEFLEYLDSSLAHILAEFPELIASSCKKEGAIEVTIRKFAFYPGLEMAIDSALVYSITYDIVSTYLPDYAKKFADDVNTSFQDIRRHIYTLLTKDFDYDIKGHNGVVELNM